MKDKEIDSILDTALDKVFADGVEYAQKNFDISAIPAHLLAEHHPAVKALLDAIAKQEQDNYGGEDDYYIPLPVWSATYLFSPPETEGGEV